MLEKQEIYCHGCSNYVQFDIDVELNGNHVLACPTCGHEHCRVVTDGVITDARWDSRNGGGWVTNTANQTSYAVTQAVTYIVTNMTVTSASTYDTWYRGTSSASTATDTGTTAGTFMYQSWMNSGRYWA